MNPIARIPREGRTLLDCGGFPHSQFLESAQNQGKMRVILYHPHRKLSELDDLRPETLSSYSEQIANLPALRPESVYFLLDDLGVFYFTQDPVETLRQEYALLEKDGWAWIRMPDTFWVIGDQQRRVPLGEYLTQRLPETFRKLYAHEIPATLREELSHEAEFVQMRKTAKVPELPLSLVTRSTGKPLTWDMSRPLSFVIELVEAKPSPKKS